MSITLENIDQLCFDFWKYVDPFDIRGEEKSSGGGSTELRLCVQNVQLLDRAVTFFVRNQMPILAKDIT